jgi:hypothetical protein
VNSTEESRLADPSLEILSIPITPPSAVGGLVRAGERVNIYRIIPPGAQVIPIGSTAPISEPVTLVAENVLVAMALNDDGSQAGTTSTGKVVQTKVLVLAVTEAQVNPILNLMAEVKGGAFMWITLAPVKP